MVWYIYGMSMVWYGMVWYGMACYGMVWYGMVWYNLWYAGHLLWLCPCHFVNTGCSGRRPELIKKSYE
jgi:chloride channel 2